MRDRPEELRKSDLNSFLSSSLKQDEDTKAINEYVQSAHGGKRGAVMYHAERTFQATIWLEPTVHQGRSKKRAYRPFLFELLPNGCPSSPPGSEERWKWTWGAFGPLLLQPGIQGRNELSLSKDACSGGRVRNGRVKGPRERGRLARRIDLPIPGRAAQLFGCGRGDRRKQKGDQKRRKPSGKGNIPLESRSSKRRIADENVGKDLRAKGGIPGGGERQTRCNRAPRGTKRVEERGRLPITQSNTKEESILFTPPPFSQLPEEKEKAGRRGKGGVPEYHSASGGRKSSVCDARQEPESQGRAK